MSIVLGLDIGFLPVRIWDVLDILIVGYLIYRIYRLLRGNMALNIFVGVLTLYLVYWLVKQLGMDLLSGVLGEFVQVGMIALVIIFQPELRRFLVYLGNSALQQRSQFINRLLFRSADPELEKGRAEQMQSLKAALQRMSRRKTGALVVLAKDASLEGLTRGGVQMDAVISQQLLESIFNKHSPLHDGAIIVREGRIRQASTILPVSESNQLPTRAGLRHRAALGITERAEVTALIVSEETGAISFAHQGKLRTQLNEEDLDEVLRQHYS